jgi:hypothetical protein
MKTEERRALLHKNILVLGALCALIFSWKPVNSQTVATGKSYINVTRPNGGTFLPGDILEVRATIAVTGGNSSSGSRINSIRFNDTINLTHFTYITGSLQMLSNEGRLQRQYSDAANTDSAHIDLASGRLRFNIGATAGAANVNTQGTGITNAGYLWGAQRPTFYNSTCIRVYVYRVQIRNVAGVVEIGSTITMSAGNFRYRVGSSGTDQLSNFSRYQIRLAPDYGLCSNSSGANAILGESGGTFGSGIPQNKAGGSTFVPAPYSFLNFSNGTPNDNFYGVANRTSGDGSTNPNVPYPNGARVFNVWDIIGDHTGATNPAAGNPPTNTGYALIINASYQTNRAFTQNISGLCEETFYEFSAWFRNICRRCGCDSTGKGSGNSGYVPGPGNDSSGVRPNLSFQINGEEYYTSGNIAYSGEWVKKGFVFKTESGQTGMTVTIRNNAPGGGGNDWAIDDISVSTCLPNMQYSPSITPNVCEAGTITIYDTVRSFFDNYVFYKWQRSTNSGSSWVDITAPAGPITPYWNGASWEYVSSYTIPPSNTTMADSADLYRLLVSTSLTNLSDNNCRSTDPTTIVTLNVIDCGLVLNTNLVSYTGKVANGRSLLRWTTTTETEPVDFDIERSTNGSNFTIIGIINGYNDPTATRNNYSFTDPEPISGKVYYRIRMRGAGNQINYTRTLVLEPAVQNFSFVSVINPFENSLYFDVNATRDGIVRAELTDAFGKIVKKKNFDLRSGVNQLSFEGTNSLTVGMYILRVESGGEVINRKVIKR